MILLAKSGDKKQNLAGRSLKEHVDDCLFIFNFLKEAFPKAAEASGLGEQYWEILKICIICHDLGKAHKEFQKLLNEQSNDWRSQRHELFSLPFVDALTGYDKGTIGLIKLVVAGHHKDFEKLQEALRFYDSGETFGMLETIEDEKESFESAFGKNVIIKDALEFLKQYTVDVDNLTVKPVDGLIRLYNKKPYHLSDKKYFNLMLLFGGMKWCDHLGSAMVTQLHKISNKDFDFLKIQQKSLLSEGFDFYNHQKECGTIKGNLFLTAPTGSGKTESAFLWLENQLKVTGQGRIFYILPFTASINAMYERLNTTIGKQQEKVGMLHGKLSDYLNNYFDDLQYDLQEKKDSIHNIKEKFKSVVTPIKIATPFQLLKHLFGLKGYEQGLFEMTGSYLIFDEIHAYSPETFAQIKVLLEFATKHLQAKVMIMTATMPRFMQVELEKCIKPFSIVKADKKLYQIFRRHKIILKEGLLSDSFVEIKRRLEENEKVLVVCNTVKSAQFVYKELKSSVSENKSLLLHGSFTGADRSKKEKDLMEKDIKLLVGTQAIEVSLDIDYNVIYTEPAPIDALIQRFGRVNRKREKNICDCIVFKDHNDSDKYIYNLRVVDKTITALEKIVNTNEGVVDEALLQQSIDEVYPDWDEEDKKKFDEQESNLKQALELLSPMLKNKCREEDFYKQFDGIKILPQCNKNIYENHLTNFDFIGAESQKVQVRKGRFMGWLKNENIKKISFSFGKNNKVSTESYLITNKVYNSDIGLIAEEEESWQMVEIF
jgi:CRISPR-associated endonuclease/helicase Cas3